MVTIKINDSLSLKELEMGDALHIFNIIDTQREYLGEWLPFVEFTKEVSDSKAFVASVVDAPDERKGLTFGIIAEGEFAGLIGFKDIDRLNLRTEIGYWLGQQYQGRGIMTSAVSKICEYGFSELDLHRIQIRCAVGNTKSINIPKRLGFTFEGIERDGEQTAEGTFWDIEVYSKLAGE